MGNNKREADLILEKVRRYRIIKEVLLAHKDVEDISWVANRVLERLENLEKEAKNA